MWIIIKDRQGVNNYINVNYITNVFYYNDGTTYVYYIGGGCVHVEGDITNELFTFIRNNDMVVRCIGAK